MGQSSVTQAPAQTTLYIIAGAILVAMLAIGKPRIGVPLLILVALIMLVRANVKAKSGG